MNHFVGRDTRMDRTGVFGVELSFEDCDQYPRRFQIEQRSSTCSIWKRLGLRPRILALCRIHEGMVGESYNESTTLSTKTPIPHHCREHG